MKKCLDVVTLAAVSKESSSACLALIPNVFQKTKDSLWVRMVMTTAQSATLKGLTKVPVFRSAAAIFSMLPVSLKELIEGGLVHA